MAIGRRELKGNCPAGGAWYACTNGAQFLGCCRSDACAAGGGSCPTSDLAAAGLGDIPYGRVGDQQCPGPKQFYTCVGPPSFFGCCASNPCGRGCPRGDLLPASLNHGDQTFLPGGAASTTSAAASATATASAAAATSTSAAPVASSGPSAGAIAGGVVGGVAALLAILGLLFFVYRRGKKRAAQPDPPYPESAIAAGAGAGEKPAWRPETHAASRTPSAPPVEMGRVARTRASITRRSRRTRR